MSRVLVAVDLGEGSDEALRQAHRYAVQTNGALAAIHVVPDLVGMRTLFPQETEQATMGALELQQRVAELLTERVHEITGRAADQVEIFVDDGVDYAQIVRRAEKWRADLVVVGAHGRGGLERVFGGVADKVVRYAHAEVLVARPAKGMGPVVAATDLSEPSLRAIAAGAREARRLGALLDVVHAVDTMGGAYFSALAAAFGAPPVAPSAEVQAQARQAHVATIEQMILRAGAQGRAVVLDGTPAAEILRYAEEKGARLVVVASHGHTALRRIALGSVAEKVIRSAHAPVLVARVPHAS